MAAKESNKRKEPQSAKAGCMLGRLVQKSNAMPRFDSVFICSQKLAPSSRKLKLHLGRPVGGWPTTFGLSRYLPTTFGCWKTRKVVGQLLFLAGWPVVAAKSQFSATESKKGHGNVFARYVCTTTLPIMSWTQGSVGSRPSGHQSRISMHDGREAKLHNSIWNECTSKHIRPKTLSCMIKSVGDRELRRVSSLQVWNVPRFPCLV